MKVLLLAEHNNQHLADNTQSLVNAATQITSSIDVLIAGFACQAVAEQASQLAGVNHVFCADNVCYGDALAENLSALVIELSDGYTHVLTPATQFGKNILPRVAARLDVSQLSDVITIIDEQTFERPIYAGNIIATVQSNDAIKIMTIRTSAFDAVGQQQACSIQALTQIHDRQLTQCVKRELTPSEHPELTSARIVIAGGRGLQNAENFQLLERIADVLGAAVGASRAAVDAGFVPNDYQIGQTGKVVAPDLYIAVGISGAIQHIAGMKDSKVIVAINQDKDAPIFQIADYGLVGDLLDVLPQLLELLKAHQVGKCEGVT